MDTGSAFEEDTYPDSVPHCKMIGMREEALMRFAAAHLITSS